MPAAVLVPILVGAGATAANAVLTSKAAKAAERARQQQQTALDQSNAVNQKATDDALALQKQMWETNQRNMQPYLQLGQNASTRLGSMTGLSGGSTGFQNPAAMWGGPQTVQMRAPDGSVRPVPKAMVPHYQQRGAQVVS